MEGDGRNLGGAGRRGSSGRRYSRWHWGRVRGRTSWRSNGNIGRRGSGNVGWRGSGNVGWRGSGNVGWRGTRRAWDHPGTGTR